MESRFSGRVAVVTGAGSGVGQASAQRFAAEGASVVVADIRAEAAQITVDLIESQGGNAVVSVTDVADEAAVAAMIATATDRFGRLDILHNNAAALGAETYGQDRRIAELDLDVWQRTLSVNTTGVLLGCKHAIPELRRSGGGSIVNTASVAGTDGGDDHAAYGSSKAAVMALTRYVASMYGPDRIRCNAVAPGLIMSPSSKAALSEKQLALFAVERPLPWPADPEDIAAVVAYLASEDARCITGQTIVVDSGSRIRRPQDAMRQWGEFLAGRRDTAEVSSP